MYAWASSTLMPKYLPLLRSKFLQNSLGNLLIILPKAEAPPTPVKSTTPTTPHSMSKPLMSHLSSPKPMPLINHISQDHPVSSIAPTTDTPPKENSESPLVLLGTGTSPEVAITPSLEK